MKKLISILIVLAVVASCKKYPEGPSFSLRSKKARVANSWRVESYFENGEDKTEDFNDTYVGYHLVTSKNLQYSLAYDLFNVLITTETGKWKFIDDKTKLRFTANGSGNVFIWTILKLKETQLWVKDETDTSLVKELHLVEF